MTDAEARERITFPIYVSDHARERARERFPGFKAARIVDEVRAALLSGRVSRDRIDGGNPHSTCLYVWTEDESRMYAIKADGDEFVVTTTFPCDDKHPAIGSRS